MYSVVLMMAMTGSGQAPAWGGGCGGYIACSGCYGCAGCYGGPPVVVMPGCCCGPPVVGRAWP